MILVLLPLLLPLGAQAQDGQALYGKYCAQCHGDEGDGQGIATRFLRPEPRDFTKGKYKIRTTATGELPMDEDLKHIIEVGLPYTAMPPFPDFSNAELDAIVEVVKAFSTDFADPEYAPTAMTFPAAPPYDPETAAEKGPVIWEQTGCSKCHGELGRGDGNSGPTLKDDWGDYIRVADLTMPWTFRGGGTREDIYRSMATGFNGTPMPGFSGAMPDEDIWAITDYIVSLSGNDPEAPYGNVVRSIGTEEELDLANADLFAASPSSMFPVIGQIVEPGRNFQPSAIAVNVQAVHNSDEIAFRLSWHDMRAETTGHNAPDLPTPAWDEELAALGLLDDSSEDADDEGSIWGDDAMEEGEEEFSWGDDAVDEGEEDEFSWGDDALGEDESEDDFWGEEEGGEQEAVDGGPDTEFSDSIALQFPLEKPAGVQKPYFLFGDTQNPVQLWNVDLAKPGEGRLYIARGSSAISPSEDGLPEVTASYEQGEWSVVFKRSRKSTVGMTFEEGTFVPFAVSVWDGFNRERGNRRGLTSWYNLYIEPSEKPSPYPPMLKAALAVLFFELLIIAVVRFRARQS